MQGTLERQADGTYKITEAPKAEMHQDTTLETLKKLGLDDNTIAAITKQSATMENSVSSAVDKVTGFELAGVPVGAAAVGAAATILIDRFVIAKLDPTNKWGSWANLGLALVIKKWAGKYVGQKTADITALLLTYEAVADYVSQGINKIIPPKTTVSQMQQSSGLRQAEVHASNYYAKAFGG